ncbi:MAG: ATP-binding protein, partial [Bacteroidota bacterium]
MKPSSIRWLIGMAAVALVGLFVVQLYWLQKAFHQETQQFGERAQLALRTLGHQLQLRYDPAAQALPPIEQDRSNQFVLRWTNSNTPTTPVAEVPYDTIIPLLQTALTDMGIVEDYTLSVTDCDSDTMRLGYFYQMDRKVQDPACTEKDAHFNCALLKLGFPNRKGFMAEGMWIWIFSSVVFVLVLLYFAYSLYTMLQQKRLSKIRADLVHNMTHELKTPIANIGIASEVLKRGAVDEDRMKQYAGIIHKENKRLQEQVEKVLQLAMVEAGQLPLKKEVLELNDLIEKVLEQFSIRLSPNEYQLEFVPSEESATVEADRFHLTNILYSLLDNAFKYSPPPAKICVRTQVDQGHVVVSVEDDGKGIAPKDHSLIFEKFYRVSTGNQHN